MSPSLLRRFHQTQTVLIAVPRPASCNVGESCPGKLKESKNSAAADMCFHYTLVFTTNNHLETTTLGIFLEKNYLDKDVLYLNKFTV